MTRTVNRAWIFDVDGVITNSVKKQITEPQLLTTLIKLASSGEPIAFITGRSLAWTADKVLGSLEDETRDEKILKNFFVVGEFGGAILTYEGGKRKEEILKKLAVPNTVRNRAKRLVEIKFKVSMRFEDDKKTVVTTERQDTFPIEKFPHAQKELGADFKTIIKEHNLRDLEVQMDRTGTSIRNKILNKSFAVSQFIKWTSEHNINPTRYIVFGDSRSDLEMPKEFARRKFQVEFVYVGDKRELLGETFPFPITFMNQPFEKGTLEFLESLNPS